MCMCMRIRLNGLPSCFSHRLPSQYMGFLSLIRMSRTLYFLRESSSWSFIFKFMDVENNVVPLCIPWQQVKKDFFFQTCFPLLILCLGESWTYSEQFDISYKLVGRDQTEIWPFDHIGTFALKKLTISQILKLHNCSKSHPRGLKKIGVRLLRIKKGQAKIQLSNVDNGASVSLHNDHFFQIAKVTLPLCQNLTRQMLVTFKVFVLQQNQIYQCVHYKKIYLNMLSI